MAAGGKLGVGRTAGCMAGFGCPQIGPKQQELTALQLEAENIKSVKKLRGFARAWASPPRRPLCSGHPSRPPPPPSGGSRQPARRSQAQGLDAGAPSDFAGVLRPSHSSRSSVRVGQALALAAVVAAAAASAVGVSSCLCVRAHQCVRARVRFRACGFVRASVRAPVRTFVWKEETTWREDERGSKAGTGGR